MDCAEAKLRIEPYVTGKLPDDERGDLESHLEACAECRLDAELTRAAHSNPSAQAAPAPVLPAEPAPAAPSASNWTIDSIFGAPAPGKQPAASEPPAHEMVEPSLAPEPAPVSEPPAEAAPVEFGVPAGFATTSAQEDSFENVLAEEPNSSYPEPQVELPAALAGPPLPPLSGGPSRNGDDQTEEQDGAEEQDETEDHGSEEGGWDFEPADQKDGALPPEGSLFFAEEALGRSKGRKGKGSFVKAVFWILGGIVGLGLLGVSVWIALAMRGESPVPMPQDLAHEATPPGQTALPPAAPAGEATAPAELGATQDPSAAHVGSSQETSKTTPTTDATAEAPPRVAQEEGRRPSLAPPKTSVPQRTKQSLAAEKTARELAALPTPWRNPPPRPVPRKPIPVDDGDDFAPPVEKPRVTAVKPPVAPAKQIETPKASAALDSSALMAIERTLAPPVPETPTPSTEKTRPAAETTAPQKTSPATETPPRPLDRLHLATLEAEQSADVTALRKLRDTWRGLVRSSIGPDRARAKREFADCLWAIQTLTTRTSDQKAALAAYRDYVLNAPAGGADPRTVARMRQLEDALTESH